MRIQLDDIVLRRPEPEDVEQLYVYRNDREVTRGLGGFSSGYAKQDLHEWIESHRNRRDEVLLVIAEAESNRCLGHAGLYKLDHRVGTAEFAILIGDPAWRGRGLGTKVTQAMLAYAFDELNLHRVYLEVLVTHEGAIRLYEKVGFQREGRLRQAQFRGGRYLDIVVMGLLAEERPAAIATF